MGSPDFDEALTLPQQLCFALYSATHAITRAYRQALGECGLTYPQYLVVLALMEHPSMTSGTLARTLRLDPGTLTPLLKRLTAAGLIVRERRAEDERVVDIKLTQQGWALRDELSRVRSTVQACTLLDEGSYHALRQTLDQLTAALSAATAAPDGGTVAVAEHQAA